MLQVENFQKTYQQLEKEVRQAIVGMSDVLQLTLNAIFAGGHVLLEGAPGLGKTLLVKSIANALGLSFHRIQFTSDLMPSDITGTQVIAEDEHGKRRFEFQPGPVFSNIVLADEINRAGPKTQSALLEAMEEKQVTIATTTYTLPQPYFVLATQNPIELEGTYPLPEAQLDRFIFKLLLQSPTPAELKEILSRTTGAKPYEVKPIFDRDTSAQRLLEMRNLVRSVLLAPPVEDILVGIIYALTPSSSSCTDRVAEYVRFGPGPRGAQAILLSAKVLALLDGRVNVSTDDIRRSVKPALRHRLILNYQAEAESITTDDIIDNILKRG